MSFIRSPSATNFRGSWLTPNFCAAGWPRKAGDRDAGIEQMLQGGGSMRRPPALQPIVLTADRRAGNARRPLRRRHRHASTGDGRSDAQHNQFCEPETIRLRGEVMLAQSRDNAGRAEAAFRQAWPLPARQSNRPLELRAATQPGAAIARRARREMEARELLGRSIVRSPKVSTSRICGRQRHCSRR